MSDEQQIRRHQQDAVDRLAREVRKARRTDPAGTERIEMLARDWPDLAVALGRLLREHGQVVPTQWKRRGTPGSGRIIVL